MSSCAIKLFSNAALSCIFSECSPRSNPVSKTPTEVVVNYANLIDSDAFVNITCDHDIITHTCIQIVISIKYLNDNRKVMQGK